MFIITLFLRHIDLPYAEVDHSTYEPTMWATIPQSPAIFWALMLGSGCGAVH